MLDAYTKPIEELLQSFGSSQEGLSKKEAETRLLKYGRNVFPSKPAPTWIQIFIRQFANPMILILGIVAVISVFLADSTDAVFIGVVLLVNAIIGAVQEHGSEKNAQALKRMSSMTAIVQRNAEVFEIPAEEIVPGDVVHIESGQKVPADLRLIWSHGLEIDESLLTGESVPVGKKHDLIFKAETFLADRKNMVFTGSLVTKGRGRGLVVETGLRTELGRIARSLISERGAQPPLLLRMRSFTRKLAIAFFIVASLMSAYLLWLGDTWQNVLMFSVALSVSAIPEGLPVALTVALAIASRRMAKRNVIVRKLPAVEALGSCTFIATDKTGTLTVNQLTIQKIARPGSKVISVTGSGLDPSGRLTLESRKEEDVSVSELQDILTAGALCNEAQLYQNEEQQWVGHGDAVDLAFLVLCHKAQNNPERIRDRFELLSEVPFEPENQFAATLHRTKSQGLISVKGAMEKVLPMCRRMKTRSGLEIIQVEKIRQEGEELAQDGFRVLALAMKESEHFDVPLDAQLDNLVFLGVVGMIDPLRPEAAEAIARCKGAGVQVAMVTGDHPKTSLAIAKQLGFAHDLSQVVTGMELRNTTDADAKVLLEKARVFARVEPQQKLEIVRRLIAAGRFVAVTGDGANDAPALKAAHVGVAMGKTGTDVAKEASDLVITDDRFVSIVAGIEEGRIAYSNIRKVIYLLISTGVAEILIVSLSLVFQTPLPLTAVQLLWLNLVTNGIQDMGLAFEPGEGDELQKPPRKPQEPIFDRLMFERVFLSALVMGSVSFWQFQSFLKDGEDLSSARNLTLLLMVLFENVMIGNCRSETKSAFSLSPLRNPLLFVGTLVALTVHLLAMHIPMVGRFLGVTPVSLSKLAYLLILSLSVLVVIELHKWVQRNGK